MEAGVGERSREGRALSEIDLSESGAEPIILDGAVLRLKDMEAESERGGYLRSYRLGDRSGPCPSWPCDAGHSGLSSRVGEVTRWDEEGSRRLRKPSASLQEGPLLIGPCPCKLPPSTPSPALYASSELAGELAGGCGPP